MSPTLIPGHRHGVIRCARPRVNHSVKINYDQAWHGCDCGTCKKCVHFSNVEYLVKRIVAVGGETYNDVEVPAGYVFVVGDNKNCKSFDSRNFGPIPVESINGRVIV